MRWSTTISFVLAVGGVLALAALVTHEQGQSAAEFHAAITKRYAARTIDRQRMLSELDIALAQAEREAQTELSTTIQLQRGRLLMEVGSFERARTDLKEVRERSGATRELALLRIELEQHSGDHRAGLALAESWLKAHPADAGVWRLAADLYRLAAERRRRHAEELGEAELVSELAASVRELIAPLVGRSPDDPRRVTLSHDLRALFGARLESVAEEILRLADLASADCAAARQAYGRSLELEPHGAALGHFARLLAQAGRTTEALDLYTAAWRVESVREDPEGCAFLLRTLRDRQLWRSGNYIAAFWVERHRATPEFLLDACRVAYGSLSNQDRDPLRLHSAALQLNLLATSELGEIPSFYIGEALFYFGGRAEREQARFFLSKFASSESPEPLPFARARAWRDIAEICRDLGLALEERTALEGAVELEPLHDGESWLRLSELQLASPHGGFRGPDLRWAMGMSLLPARTEELKPRWNEIGNLQLKAIGFDVEAVRSGLARGQSWTPSLEASPYELYTLARLHLEAKDLYTAENLLQRLLEEVPGFVPALDLKLTLSRMRAKPREIADAFLARLEQTGYDELSRQIRRTLPAEVLQPKDERRILHADPEGSGRLAVARSLALRGEKARAARILERIPAAELSQESRLFAARLELESGAPTAAFERLAGLGQALFSLPEALELYVQAGLRVGKREELHAPLAQFLTEVAPERQRLIALCDRLLQSGEVELARATALRLEQAGKEFRGGDVLVRLGACALARANGAELDTLLERAGAFDTQGAAELIELLALEPEAGAGAVRTAVQAVRESRLTLSPCAAAALELFTGDSEALRASLHEARTKQTQDPRWTLFEAALAGADSSGANTGPARADARFVEAVGAQGLARLVLALERPWLAAFALARLDALGDKGGGPWPHWWRASIRAAAGEKELEQRELRALLAGSPDFAPAWDRLQAQALDPAREGEGDLDLALERAAALGASSGGEAEPDFERSRRLAREGDLDQALQAARAAAVSAPDSGPVLRHLGRLYVQRAQLREALAPYRRALSLLPSRSGARSTAEFLELCARARNATPPVFDAESLQAELNKLARLRPDDPRVLLALARADMDVNAARPAQGVARVYARLERFQADHPRVSFERLASGSTRSWTEFLLGLDPARAVAFLDQELEREPGNVDAWALLARCYAEQGKNDDALREIVLVQRLAPGAATLREYVRVRSQSDWTPEGIRAVVERLRQEQGAGAQRRTELALEARALLNLGLRAVPNVLELTDALTPAEFEAMPADERLEFLWVRTIALLSRGGEADRVEARARLEQLEPLVATPEQKALLAALRGLAQTAAQAGS